MRRASLLFPVLAILLVAAIMPNAASASRWEIRQEIREGGRDVARERREAARELRRCTTRDCVRKEMREGHREVSRERREARREIRQEVREDIFDRYYNNDGRWYRDGRYWDRYDYERRYYHRGYDY